MPKSKNLIKFFLIIISLAFLAILFLIYSHFLKLRKTNNQPNSTQSDSNKFDPEYAKLITEAEKEDPTTNWQTYENEEYGFSFKYPTYWTKKIPESENDDTIIYINSDKEYGNGVEPIKYFLWINKISNLPTQDLKITNIGDYSAYITDKEPSANGSLTYYVFQNKDNIIKISFSPYIAESPYEGQKEQIKIFDQILSTFQFIN